jgi:hypothetical protein
MGARKMDTGDGRQVVVQLVIKVWSDGALSVEGPIEDKLWTLAALENAKDAVRNHRSPSMVDHVAVPKYDVTLPTAHPVSVEKL